MAFRGETAQNGAIRLGEKKAPAPVLAAPCLRVSSSCFLVFIFFRVPHKAGSVLRQGEKKNVSQERVVLSIMPVKMECSMLYL